MLKRIINLWRAFISLFHKDTEPELLLKKLKGDLKNRIPQINAKVAEIQAYEKKSAVLYHTVLTEIEVKKLYIEQMIDKEDEKNIALLKEQILVLEKMAANYLGNLNKAKQETLRVIKIRDEFENKIQSQIAEIEYQISRSQKADVENMMANLIGDFENHRYEDSVEALIGKVDEKAALSSAKMDVADSSIERQIEKLTQ